MATKQQRSTYSNINDIFQYQQETDNLLSVAFDNLYTFLKRNVLLIDKDGNQYVKDQLLVSAFISLYVDDAASRLRSYSLMLKDALRAAIHK